MIINNLATALQSFINEVNAAVHAVADMGPGADLSRLSEATKVLDDAIQEEDLQS